MTQTSTTSSDRLSRIAVAVTLVLLPLIYFFPAVLGKVTLAPGDGWSQIFGIRILIGRMLAHGELPLWNPYIFAGMPLLASIQPGALYPPTWLFAVLSPQTAMNVLVLTTYHLALIGTYLFARRIGINRIGAILAGTTFAFGGYMIAHLGHTNRITAAAWLPWILLAVEKCWSYCQPAPFVASDFAEAPAHKNNLRNRQLWRWMTLGAVFIALQFYAGEPQMTLYSLMIVAAYGLFTLLFRVGHGNRLRFLGAGAAMAVCGALLLAIQLLPERELLKQGDRAGIDYYYFSQFSFPPKQIFELFFPYYFGGAALEPYRVPYWGSWNITETCGYVGMAVWLLAFAAIFAIRRGRKDNANSQIKFWALCAVVALLLAFGSHLPFNIHRLLYRVPVYNLFRASGRHLMEFTFAMGLLAGWGVTALAQLDRVAAKRALLKSIVLLTGIIGAAVIVYRFFDHRLVMETPLPPEAGSLSNSDLYFPVVFFGLSILALLIYARRWSSLSGVAIVAMLFLDLMSWGFFFEWRLINYNVAEKLADPPAVKFIKQREPDWKSFRIASYSPEPYKRNEDALDYPNISIVRGLQSVNGYDPVRLGQMAEIAGRMTLEGVIVEPNAMGATHQGFNLLNAKYLLNEKQEATGSETVELGGIGFKAKPINLMLGPWSQTRLYVKGLADELAIISAMGNSRYIRNGTPVLNIKIYGTSGQVIERELQIGRDTAEWAYERGDVRPIIKHDRAPVIESWNVTGFEGHRYLARLKFDRMEIESVELNYLLNEADITLTRASLFDSQANISQPLEAVSLPPDRWQKLGEFGEVEVYENLKAMPRAWFVGRAVLAPSAEVLRTIKAGRWKDGTLFNPAETVLLESELFAKRGIKTPLVGAAGDTPKAEVKVTRYETHRIEVQTNNPGAGFLVLSEIYYRGWEASVDGQRLPVERVNFALRGVELPPGQHKVEFFFQAPSFRKGAVFSAIGVLLLCLGGIISRKVSEP